MNRCSIVAFSPLNDLVVDTRKFVLLTNDAEEQLFFASALLTFTLVDLKVFRVLKAGISFD